MYTYSMAQHWKQHKSKFLNTSWLHIYLIPLLIAICLVTGTSSIYAKDTKGNIGINLNYPGVGIRYFFSPFFSMEAKGQFESDVTVGGLRGYIYFTPHAPVRLFTGLEGDYCSFKGEVSKGQGYAGQFFVGGETFLSKRLSLQMDIGPAYISLEDKDTKVKTSGIEYIVNMGITFYIGK